MQHCPSDAAPGITVIDHDNRTISVENVIDTVASTEPLLDTTSTTNFTQSPAFAEFAPTARDLNMRLQSPVTTTYIDVNEIAFERNAPKSSGMLFVERMNVINHIQE